MERIIVPKGELSLVILKSRGNYFCMENIKDATNFIINSLQTDMTMNLISRVQNILNKYLNYYYYYLSDGVIYKIKFYSKIEGVIYNLVYLLLRHCIIGTFSHEKKKDFCLI